MSFKTSLRPSWLFSKASGRVSVESISSPFPSPNPTIVSAMRKMILDAGRIGELSATRLTPEHIADLTSVGKCLSTCRTFEQKWSSVRSETVASSAIFVQSFMLPTCGKATNTTRIVLLRQFLLRRRASSIDATCCRCSRAQLLI